MNDLANEPGLTVTLATDPVGGGLLIRDWMGDLPDGTHVLVPLCLAERAVAVARAEAVRAHGFIFDLGCDLHHRRASDWFPEAAHNAADQMSEDMRLLGNACADFIPVAAGGARAGHIAETFNEFGTPVSMFRCRACQTAFTVCPAVPEDRRDQWTGCMADGCSTYDESRDGDKLFDAGKVQRVGDRSHLRCVPAAEEAGQ